ncbi:MAG: hypothetical protein ACLPX5_07155 [Dissulfurispiraceae bacterium]
MSQKEPDSEIDLLKSEIRRLRKSIHELTPPLSVMLKRRGFSIFKKDPSDDLLLPGKDFIDGYYEMLKKYSFRLFLRDVIQHQPLFTLSQVTRYATKEVTAEYLEYLSKVGLIATERNFYKLTKGPIKSFGENLEWLVAEIFKRELLTEAFWGVKIKKTLSGGDYDLLAKIDGAILYMEVKSSPPKQIYQKEIRSFNDRVRDLMPEIALFFVDTELRMKDKIVPMFEDDMRLRSTEPPEISRLEKELFEVTKGKIEGTRLFIVNAKDSIVGNIERILTHYFRRG